MLRNTIFTITAKAGIAVLLTVALPALAVAQTESGGQPPRESNRNLRTRTWSVFLQGGTSWATGVWYERHAAKCSYNLAPAVGGGVDFNLRPWVRLGAEYVYSRYRREQRFSSISPAAMPAKVYGNYLMNFHNAKLGAAFNIMELWSKRQAQWLNIYLGTGVGCMLARGNEYGMWFGATKTQGGVTTPLTGGVINNTGNVIISGTVQTVNRHEAFRRVYIPLTLHAEADVSRRFTLGLKGEVDWLLNRKTVAPQNLIFALATVRYNFVASRAQLLNTFYAARTDSLNSCINDLRGSVEQERQRADNAEAARAQLEQANADLQAQLDACNRRTHLTPHIVFFAHNRFECSAQEQARLRAFLQEAKGTKLSLVAQASTPGTPDYNQHLSEQRLQYVTKLLLQEGFAKQDIEPATAVGEQNGIADAGGRIVTITIQEQ